MSTRPNNPTRELKVFFPFNVLKKDPTLLNPANTESTYEYYLLENLASGLVKDSLEDPREYQPSLASSWKQMNSKTWTFQLEPNLKWSDGTDIECKHWVDHFNRLRNTGSRHINYLKNIESVQCENDQITLRFKEETNRGLLHELSLADSFLILPENLTKDWSKTSGPYFVSDYRPKDRILSLEKNVHFHIELPETTPKFIRLIGPELSSIPNLFRKGDIDILYIGAYTFRKIIRAIALSAPKQYKSHPTVIHYFQFNPNHADSMNIHLRKSFSWLLRDFVNESGAPSAELERELQIVPQGFQGRLGSVPNADSKHIQLPQQLTIALPNQWEELREYFSGLSRMALVHKCNLNILFLPYSEASHLNSDVFAWLATFKGNQRDPLGSWAFLADPSMGSLRPFGSEIQKYLARATHADDEIQRIKILESLHSDVLQKAFLLPLFSEGPPVYVSKNVTLDRWNPFDMRLRFYETEMSGATK